MSQALSHNNTIRTTSTRWGGLVLLVAAALVTYGAYGDANAAASQRSAVPAIIGLAFVATAVVFGLLVPAGLRAAEERTAHAERWAMWHAVAALISAPIFWSGLPLILGSAAALLALDLRRRTGSSRVTTFALALGLFMAGGSVLFTVVGNILSHT